MAAKKVGELIKEARTNAGLTQEALAKKVDGLSASEISRAERGEASLTKEELKAIAKATGVTQKSLLEAPEGGTSSGSSSSGKSGKTTGSSSSGKSGKTSDTSSAKKTDKEEDELTAAEKKFLKLYREASAKDRELAKLVLEGKSDSAEFLLQIVGNKVTESSSASSASSGAASGDMTQMLGSLLGNVLGKK